MPKGYKKLIGQQYLNHKLKRKLQKGGYSVTVTGKAPQPRACGNKDQNNHTQVQVGLLLLGLLIAALLLPGGSSACDGRADRRPHGFGRARRRRRPPRPGRPEGAEGRQGPGRRARPGRRDAGARGAAGADAPAEVIKQTINIGWQNDKWAGFESQRFTAPGIGSGKIVCSPPTAENSYTGEQLISFTPIYNTRGTPGNVKPEKWATTMWTARHGGNEDDANAKNITVIRTARLDRGNQPDFYESFSTAPALHYDPESTGSMHGIITTEPWDEKHGAAAADDLPALLALELPQHRTQIGVT